MQEERGEAILLQGLFVQNRCTRGLYYCAHIGRGLWCDYLRFHSHSSVRAGDCWRCGAHTDFNFNSVCLCFCDAIEIPLVNSALLKTHVEIDFSILLVCPSFASSKRLGYGYPFSPSFLRFRPGKDPKRFIQLYDEQCERNTSRGGGGQAYQLSQRELGSISNSKT
jgi:hypothetical protein